MPLQQNGGRFRDAVRGQPPRPLSLDPSLAGPPEEIRSQSDRGGLVQALQVRGHRLRGPGQRAELQQGLRLQPQQAGQPAVHRGAGQASGGDRGDRQRPDPRHGPHQPGQAREHLRPGEALFQPGLVGLLQEPSRGGADPHLPRLLAGRGGCPGEVLRQLQGGGAAPESYGRAGGQKALGHQRGHGGHH